MQFKKICMAFFLKSIRHSILLISKYYATSEGVNHS